MAKCTNRLRGHYFVANFLSCLFYLDVASLQKDDGSFMGDKWGEVDTRFSYCALNCCALLGKLDKINVKKAVQFGRSLLLCVFPMLGVDPTPATWPTLGQN